VFSVQWTAEMAFAVIIGGIGTIEGPIIGTIVYMVLQQTLQSYNAWYLIILGIVAIASRSSRGAGCGGRWTSASTSGSSPWGTTCGHRASRGGASASRRTPVPDSRVDLARATRLGHV
jgi:hypothetical protein